VASILGIIFSADAAQRLGEVERRAAKAAQRDQKERLAQLEQQLAAVIPPPPAKYSRAHVIGDTVRQKSYCEIRIF
jgi:transcription elongation GreA/GreB family factor